MQPNCVRCGRPVDRVVPILTKSGVHLATYQGCAACYVVFRRELSAAMRVTELQTAGQA